MTNHKHPMRSVTGPVLCMLSLLFLAAGPAAAGDDVKGWMVALDLALTQPGGLDQEYALQSDTSTTPVQGTRHLLDIDADSTFRITGGYNFGLDLGSLEVSYWSFDSDDARSETMGGVVYPTVFGYGYFSNYSLYSSSLTSSYGVRTRAESSLKASSLDVDYSRAIDAGENFTLRWLAGLRTVTFEEEVKFDGSDTDYYGYGTSIQQRRHVDSDAFGVKVGGRGTFGFTKRFSMEGGASISLLRADVKGDSEQTIIDSITPFTGSERNRGEDSSGRGQILDLEIRGIWTEGPLSIYLGYSASSWEGLVRDPNPPRTSFFPLAAGRSRDTVSFDSFNVGAIYRFGGRRLAAP